jgi:hypothetical protein
MPNGKLHKSKKTSASGIVEDAVVADLLLAVGGNINVGILLLLFRGVVIVEGINWVTVKDGMPLKLKICCGCCNGCGTYAIGLCCRAICCRPPPPAEMDKSGFGVVADKLTNFDGSLLICPKNIVKLPKTRPIYNER